MIRAGGDEVSWRMSLSRLFQSSTLMTWMNMFVQSTSLFLLLPLATHRLGTAELSLWLLFATIRSLFVLFDLGLSPTFVRLFSYANAGLDIDAIARVGVVELKGNKCSPGESIVPVVMHESRRIYRGIVAIAAIGIMTAGTWSVSGLVAKTADTTDAGLAWCVVAANTLLQLAIMGFGAAIQGLGQVARWHRTQAMFNCAGLALSAFALLATPRLAVFVAMPCLASAGALVWARKAARELTGAVSQGPGEATAAQRRKLRQVAIASAWRSGLGLLFAQGVVLGSGVVYARMASAEELASYLVLLQVLRAVSSFSQPPFYSKIPELAYTYAAGEVEKLRGLAVKYAARSFFAFNGGVLAGYVFLSYVFPAIGKNVQSAPGLLWALANMAFLVERIGAVHLQLYSLSNHIVWHTVAGINAAIIIVISVSAYGIVGIAAFPGAMLAAYMVFFTPYTIFLAERLINLKEIRFATRTYIPSLVIGLITSCWFMWMD